MAAKLFSMADEGNLVQLPPEVWDGTKYTHIHAAILFADLENSVMISSALSPPDYNSLIDNYQQTMNKLVDNLRSQGLPVAEASVVGDQLAIFFYDPEEVWRNYQLDGPNPVQGTERAELIATCRQRNEDVAFSAFKSTIQLKNLWLTQNFNVERVMLHREPLGLGIGIHCGHVYLANRADGTRRIEGYIVNFAKRIEGYSREGLYSHIMVSKEMRDILRGSVIKHTQLSQRIFFHQHLVSNELLKGVAQNQPVYELKFFHQLGIHIDESAYGQYDSLFALDRTNVWAYYQLFAYYIYKLKDDARAFELAKAALVAHPMDEKVLLDLAKCYHNMGKLEQSKQIALEAVALNRQFDLVHEHIAVIAAEKDDTDTAIYHWREAVRLSPNSPVNNFNLGLTLVDAGFGDEGEYYIREAVRIYPEYQTWPKFQIPLNTLNELGKLPAGLVGTYLDSNAGE